jgi:putative transcriptional regulator
MPQTSDPNFARSVVLLCEYTEKGAFGLVVNRQMTDPAWTVVKTDPPIEVNRDLRLWVGGPVEPQRTWVLMAESRGLEEEEEISPGVLLSTSHELTLDILRSGPTARARVVVGCAAWGPGQLDNEIASSGWLTTNVDPALIFNTPPDEMWETAIRRLGANPSALQQSSGVH